MESTGRHGPGPTSPPICTGGARPRRFGVHSYGKVGVELLLEVVEFAVEAGRLVQEMKKYTRPDLLVCDELGYLPIDKRGADLLFQIISERYERGAIVLTTNKVFKQWPSIFNNDATLTSAILDRILHHAETVIIEGKSYRMKDRIET